MLFTGVLRLLNMNHTWVLQFPAVATLTQDEIRIDIKFLVQEPGNL
jgi:hypothetical protein